MGSGKTTVSQFLSEKTGAARIDMDREIEKAEEMPIRTIFIKYGEHEFRNRESELLDRLCDVAGAVPGKASKYAAFADRSESLIVSCGGGIILDDLNRKALHRQYTIFLEADPATLFERVNGDAGRPFAFMDVADETERRRKFLDLYKKREPLYKEAASVIIQTDGKTPEEIAEEILGAFPAE
jgi:shikimate kinase